MKPNTQADPTGTPENRGSKFVLQPDEGAILVDGEPAPEPFERPEDTLVVEGRTGFGPPLGA